jgi:hypothetical protein
MEAAGPSEVMAILLQLQQYEKRYMLNKAQQ